jgi:glycerol-3-phosphate responsive antiterminator
MLVVIRAKTDLNVAVKVERSATVVIVGDRPVVDGMVYAVPGSGKAVLVDVDIIWIAPHP